MNIVVLQRVFFELVSDAITGPLWYYTKGTVYIFSWWLDHVRSSWHGTAVGLWARNIMVPMFGQYDWQGRLVSFFIRFFQVIFRFIGFVFISAGFTVITILWFIGPIAAVYYFIITIL